MESVDEYAVLVSACLTESATMIAVTWSLLRPLGASWIPIDSAIAGRSGVF